MRRLLFLSGLLFLCLQLFTSQVSADDYIYDTQGEASSAATAYCSNIDCGQKSLQNGIESDWYNIWDSSMSYDSRFIFPKVDCQEPNTFYEDSFGNMVCDIPPFEPSPGNCEEEGLDYDSSDGGSCVSECPNGALNGICLNGAPVGEPNESEDPSGCQPDASDWQGVFEGKHYCDSNLPEPATCPEGEMAYIETDDSGSGAFVCGEPISEPGEAEESETETTETTTDQDGNTVTETTDGDGNTTTTTSDGNGNSSTTNNYPGTDSETGEPCTAESVACYPTPDTQKGLCKDGGSLCDDVRDIRDAMDQESDRTEKTGEFNTEQANSEVSQAETDLETGINSIRSEIGGYFDLALSGGDMVCGPGVDVLGTTIQICPSEMKEELAVIAQIVMLIAALISLMIIFR
jgi:hypothetical protein